MTRLEAVRRRLREEALSGMLITHYPDQLWLTGFTGEDGAVLVTAKSVVLLTDGRFAETAAREAPWAKAVVRTSRGPDTLAKAINANGGSRVGIDPATMTVQQHAGIVASLKKAKLVEAPPIVANLRRTKDRDEIQKIRKAIDVAEAAMKKIRRHIEVGVTELEIAARLEFEMRKLGASGPSFPPIVAAGANASLPHYEPQATKIRNNQLVLVDWGARVDGYVSDLTRVFAVGRVAPKLARIYAIVDEARRQAIEAVRPGITTGALDRVARQHITKAGFGAQFSHSLGHGIGLEVHEAPGLRAKSETVIESGMVITIEPGIYVPGLGGVRLEDDVLVTDDGCEVLTRYPIASVGT
ncbi:MAG: M24 family metallopeptidase [Phycisphaerae bacterium]